MSICFVKTNEEFMNLALGVLEKKTGGQVSFFGNVRAVDQGKSVSFLSYEAHVDLAQSLFLQLLEEVNRRFGIIECHAIHRLGRVEVGQAAVLIAVGADHRHEAFVAARFLIDELKKQLPIWKKQVFADGTESWLQGCNHDHKAEVKKPEAKALLARGMKDLKSKRVLLVGAGGLGCPLAIGLSSLCSLSVYDADVVSKSNLSRQFIYSRNDIGQNKAWLLKRFLGERALEIEAHESFLTEAEALLIAKDFDLIIDGSDCPITKKMLKRVAFMQSVPLIVASVYRSEGEVQVFVPKAEACLSCFEQQGIAEESCADSGVFTHTCSMVASVACDKALSVLSGQISTCEMLLIDVGASQIKKLEIAKDAQCSVCGEKKRQLVRIK